MIKILMAAVAALSIGTAAQAATISATASFTQPMNISGTALQAKAVIIPNHGPQGFVSSSFSADLVNIGDSFTTDLFVVRTLNSTVKANEPNPRPFALQFATSVGTASLTGTTYGKTQGSTSFGVMDFTGPAFINIGGGQRLKISMADVFFNEGPAGFYTPGKANGGIASVTLSLAEVPVPASFPLLLAALGGMAWVRRRAGKKAA
jgi:hypothetical protein